MRRIVIETSKRGRDSVPAPIDWDTMRADVATIKDQLSGGNLGGFALRSSSYGADGTGSVNADGPLQDMLDDMSATGFPGIVDPGDYLLGAPLRPGDNTVLHMHGATLKINYPDPYGPAIKIVGSENVTIEGGYIDGQRQLYDTDTRPGGLPVEHKHGVSVHGGKHIALRDMEVFNCRGDGVTLAPLGNEVSPGNFTDNTEHIYMENVLISGNARQGMSVTGARHGTYVACAFLNTLGTDPEAGIDFERNTGDESSDNHHFYGCDISGNAGGGVLLSGPTLNQDRLRNITFTDCAIHSNGMVGVQFNRGQDFTFTNCDVRDTGPHHVSSFGGFGYFLYAQAKNVRIIGGAVVNSSNHGITSQGGVGGTANLTVDGVQIEGTGNNGIFLYAFDRANITNCDFKNNGRSINVHGTSTHVRFVGNDVRGNTNPASIASASNSKVYDNPGLDW